MKTILAPRASAIIYDLLTSAKLAGPFLLPANICPIVPITFMKAGVGFEFVDISPNTLAIDLDEVDDRLESSGATIGGLLYSHTYGHAATPREFFGRLKSRWPHLLVIDDRCLCRPQLDPEVPQSVDVALYSSGYAKIADLGFGGYAFVNDGLEVRHTTLPFRRADLLSLEADYKARLRGGEPFIYQDGDWLETDSELPAWGAYGERLRSAAAESLAHRRSINAVYNSLLPGELRLPDGFQLWRYNLRLPDSERVLQAIFAAGLFASNHYASLAGMLGPGKGGKAAKLAEHIVNLFNDSHYTIDMAEETARVVLENS